MGYALLRLRRWAADIEFLGHSVGLRDLKATARGYQVTKDFPIAAAILRAFDANHPSAIHAAAFPQWQQLSSACTCPTLVFTGHGARAFQAGCVTIHRTPFRRTQFHRRHDRFIERRFIEVTSPVL